MIIIILLFLFYADSSPDIVIAVVSRKNPKKLSLYHGYLR